MSEKLKNIFEPSEKVQKMYEAISELVQEKKDVATLKVQDITSRAGIGKGTAYEYFSSKEEIRLATDSLVALLLVVIIIIISPLLFLLIFSLLRHILVFLFQ